MLIYKSSMRELNVPTQSERSYVALDSFGHIRRDKYAINVQFDRDKNVSEHRSDRLSRTA